MRRTMLALLFFLSLVHPAIGQSSSQVSSKSPAPAVKDGVITGRVIGEDGQPIAKAMIEFYSIAAKPAGFQPVYTDADGNFKLTGLLPAPYVLRPFVPGYVPDRPPEGVEFYHIGEHVTLKMVKGGVITGQVTDANGAPMVGIRVTPRLIRDRNDRPVQMRRETFLLGRKSDDRGIYRLYGLEPGVYIVTINRGSEYLELGNAREVSIYHPSTTRESAAEVTVQSGLEVAGIDIRHRIDRGHSINGKVVDEGGEFDRVYVIINNLADGQPEMGAGVAKSGSFEIRGLAEGDYEIMAGRNEDGRSMTASMPRKVTIKGTDVSGIELKIEKLGSISGRIVKEASILPEKCEGTSKISLEEILFNVKPVEGKGSSSILMRFRSSVGLNGGGVDQKGNFQLINLFAGNYQLLAELPAENAFLRSITRPASAQGAVRPVDISMSGIAVKPGESVTGVEVKIADGAAILSGKVVPATETEKLPERIRVHLIPSEVTAANDVLRYAEANLDGGGTFEFKHITPGKYWLIAKPEIEKQQDRPAAWDASERAKLRQEAEAARNEIVLQPCQRVKDDRVHIYR